MRATLRPRRWGNLPSQPTWTASVTRSPSCRRASTPPPTSCCATCTSFNQQHGWEGFRSCAHWLNWRTGLDLGAAPREAARGRRAGRVAPHLRGHGLRPALLFESPGPVAGWLPLPPRRGLLAVACGATAAQVERLVRGWRQADQAAQADGEQVRLASRMLSTQVDDNGMLLLRARLTPEVGAVLLRAVEAALGAGAGARGGRGGRRADDCASGVPMRWGWWPRVRWPAGSIRATPATASRSPWHVAGGHPCVTRGRPSPRRTFPRKRARQSGGLATGRCRGARGPGDGCRRRQ